MNNIKKLVCFSLLTAVFTSALTAQSTSGTISDMDGLPLPGATVINLNTSNGSTSDFDGKFSIETSVNDVLQFTYVGYKSKEITISESNDDLNIQLEQGNELEEVVVSSFGFEKKTKYCFIGCTPGCFPDSLGLGPGSSGLGPGSLV